MFFHKAGVLAILTSLVGMQAYAVPLTTRDISAKEYDGFVVLKTVQTPQGLITWYGDAPGTNITVPNPHASIGRVQLRRQCAGRLR
jgi:hypothetical protein